MSRRLIVALIVVGVTVAVAGSYAADPPKQVVIKACQKKKPGVAFNHEQHAKKQKIACKTCHHTGKTDKTCAAASCHAGKAEGKKPGCQEMGLAKNPYHITCIGCHKKLSKGPKGCKDCHK